MSVCHGRSWVGAIFFCTRDPFLRELLRMGKIASYTLQRSSDKTRRLLRPQHACSRSEQLIWGPSEPEVTQARLQEQEVTVAHLLQAIVQPQYSRGLGLDHSIACTWQHTNNSRIQYLAACRSPVEDALTITTISTQITTTIV